MLILLFGFVCAPVKWAPFVSGCLGNIVNEPFGRWRLMFHPALLLFSTDLLYMETCSSSEHWGRNGGEQSSGPFRTFEGLFLLMTRLFPVSASSKVMEMFLLLWFHFDNFPEDVLLQHVNTAFIFFNTACAISSSS